MHNVIALGTSLEQVFINKGVLFFSVGVESFYQ